LIFWPHLCAGVVAGVVIVTMSVTGVLLTYERQLISWSDRHLRSTPAPGVPRLSIEALLTTVRRQHPEVVPTGITIGSAADATAVLATAGGALHFDAYSGRLLGRGAAGVRAFMSETRAWHRWLSIDGEGRGAARAITGWSNVLFLFIVVSGAYLWLPRTWTRQNVRRNLVFTGATSSKARDFNWHHVFGIWSFVPLFIVVLSAIPISFQWGNALVYRAVGEQPPGRPEAAPAAANRPAAGRAGGARRAGGGPEGRADRGPREETAIPLDGLNALWAQAEQQAPGWRTINMRLPEPERAQVVFAIDHGDGGQPHLRSTLTLDRRSGAVVTYDTFSSLTLGRRVRNVMRFAHTGEVLGLPGQTVAGLATFAAVVLGWTGIALAVRRFRAWIRQRQAALVVASRDRTAA
jgi:uncharacterized iron-regulated membrane protein